MESTPKNVVSQGLFDVAYLLLQALLYVKKNNNIAKTKIPDTYFIQKFVQTPHRTIKAKLKGKSKNQVIFFTVFF